MNIEGQNYQMTDHLSASLIITTYNWPEALKLVLRSVCEQSVKPDQVIVADDGSSPETAQVVKEIMSPSGLEWCHVRHQDKGVRQSRIKNFAIKYSRYCSFVVIPASLRISKQTCFLFSAFSNLV